MKKYILEIYNDNPLIQIAGHLLLIDTGCYKSVSFNDIMKIKINDKNYIIYPINIGSKLDFNLSFGKKIDGVLGLDILKDLMVLEVDLLNYCVIFGESNKPKTNVCKHNNLVTEITIDSKKAISYLDTGAHEVVVFNNDLIDINKKIDDVLEPTFMGTFKVEKYMAQFSIGSCIKETSFLKNNINMPHMPGIDLYFGLNQFSNEYYVIDFKENIYYFR